MKIILSILVFILSVISISSCYYDKEELLYGNSGGPCTDTTGIVSYSGKVVPLFLQYCNSCHTGSFPSGGILMGTYAADKVIAQNGKLYNSINHAFGFSAMPKGAGKLNNCQIATIKKWIDGGILNN